MRRTLLLVLLVLASAAALAIGSYSALAGSGPVGSLASAVIGSDEAESPDGDGQVSSQDDAGDDAGAEVNAQEGEDTPQANGARRIAAAIEEAFGAEEGSVWALHQEEGMGFGAIFHLYALAAAQGASVESLLASLETNGDGEFELALGEMRKSLSEAELEALESGPKNLGQLVKEAKGHDEFAADAAKRHGPPEGVPARDNN